MTKYALHGQASTPQARKTTNYSNSPSMAWQRTIRRTVRKDGQTYLVHLDTGARTGEPVRIRQVFRPVTPVWGHRLYFELSQPARNMTVSFDYTSTNIVDMRHRVRRHNTADSALPESRTNPRTNDLGRSDRMADTKG